LIDIVDFRDFIVAQVNMAQIMQLFETNHGGKLDVGKTNALDA
jgi:hypothetical protein